MSAAEPEPAGKPKKSQPLLLALGCAGCGFLLLLVGVGGTMGYLLLQQQRATRHAPSLPADWRDSLRAEYRLPAVAFDIAPPPSEDGDIAQWITFKRTAAESSQGTERLRAERHVTNGQPLSGTDSAIIRAAGTDPRADSAFAASRQRSLEVLSRLADDSGRPRLLPPLGFGLPITGYVVGRAADRLILRAEARRWKGDVRGARADLLAVIVLGRTTWQQDLGPTSLTQGRRVIQSGATGLVRLAQQAGDTLLERRARDLLAWAERRPGLVFRIAALAPESVLVVAQDTTLPRGLRSGALESLCLSALFRTFGGVFFGPSDRVVNGVRALTTDVDPVVARVAIMADSTLRRLEAAGPRGRYRIATGRVL